MHGIAAMGLLGWRGPRPGKRWGRRPRLRRLLLLLGAICFSPVLLPLVCLSLPLVCVLALCFRFGRGGACGQASRDDAGRFPRRYEEGGAGAPQGEARPLLLQRYLEDQMGLVGSVVWDCYGDGDDDDDDGWGEGR